MSPRLSRSSVRGRRPGWGGWPRRSLSGPAFPVLLWMLVVMWGLEILDVFVFGQSLDRFGIMPRQIIGLRGLAFAPFLHGNFTHLAGNTVPFLILGSMVLARGARDFLGVTVFVALISGLAVWLLGAPGSLHIGASGLIFGYFGFLLAYAWFEQSLMSILFAAVVILLYGGMIWGIQPFQPHVSWIGHLFGLVGGIWTARLLTPRTRRLPRR